MENTPQTEEEVIEDIVQHGKRRRKLRERLIDITHSKYGLGFLYFITFIESAFFPIPPDFLVVPVIASRPKSWKKISINVSIASITGSFLGYFIGAVLFATVGTLIVETYGLEEKVTQIGEIYNNNAFWSLVIAAFTPLPYKVFTITAGVFKVNLLTFALASFIGRGARYMLVGYLAHIGGSIAFWGYLKKLKKTTWIVIGIIALILVYVFFVK